MLDIINTSSLSKLGKQNILLLKSFTLRDFAVSAVKQSVYFFEIFCKLFVAFLVKKDRRGNL